MKYALIALALIFSFACTANPVMRTKHKRAPLKGKVKTVRSYGLMTSNEAEVRERGKDFYSVDSFNSIGLKRYSRYVERGVMLDETNYSYDENGKMIEECYNDSGNKEIMCKTYTYNTSGNLIQEKWYWFGQLSSQVTYTYISGLLATKEDSTAQGIRKTDYKHNDRGGIVKETTYNYDASSSTIRYTYYPDGNMRSEISSYGFGDYRTTYTYDEHNNEILAEENLDDGPVSRRFASEYIYDSQGNWIRVITDFPGDYANSPVKEMEIREIEYY